jgi:hypothetical protein
MERKHWPIVVRADTSKERRVLVITRSLDGGSVKWLTVNSSQLDGIHPDSSNREHWARSLSRQITSETHWESPQEALDRVLEELQWHVGHHTQFARTYQVFVEELACLIP